MNSEEIRSDNRDIIVIFCVMTGLFWFSQYAYMPQLTKYASQIGASYKTIGMISGAYGLSQVLLRIPLGLYSDYLGKRKIFVVIGILMTILSPILVYFIPGEATLVVARFLSGVAAATWVNITVMFSGYFASAESTKAIGIINSTNRFGQLTAFIVGGIVVAIYDIRAAFLISAVGGFIALLFCMRLKDQPSVDGRTKFFNVKDIPKLYKNRRLLSISILGLVSQFITFSTIYSFTPLLATKLGAQSVHLNLYNIAFMLPQIFVAALAGTVIRDRFGERNTLTAGFAAVTLCCFLSPLVPHYLLFIPVMLISGIGNALSFPLLMGIAIKDVALEYKSSAMGFYQSVYAVGMTIGPLLLGMISQAYGLTSGFVFTGLVGVLALAAIQIPALGIHNSVVYVMHKRI
jgi:MFS family permease